MSAILSPCGTYRYRLDRALWDTETERQTAKRVAWIMVNPSTADATKDDPTIRKVVGFSQRLGYLNITVGNLFAHRSTDVRGLRAAPDPTGPNNDYYLRGILSEADLTIVAWGPLAKLPPELRQRWGQIVWLAALVQKPLHCLGVAKDGHPRHPLMLPYSTELRPWEAPL